MSFKEQLTFNPQVTIENLKKTLLDASQNGESSVFIPLTDEYGYKCQVIFQFLTNENITFKKNYDSRQVKKMGYYDPHMAYYAEYVAANGGKSTYTYMDKEFIFKGVTVYFT